MCGIFGIVLRERRADLGEILVRAGRRLSYRGYDSVGCATLCGNGIIDLRKDVGSIEQVSKALNFFEMTGDRGICQLRWATFGPPSKMNAQPHFDSTQERVGAHNGNITNNPFLREALLSEGIVVESQNDGETLVKICSKYISQGLPPEVAYTKVVRETTGDFAFVMAQRNTRELHCLKMGSSLYLGLGDGFVCCSSDLPSILEFTRRFLRLRDGDLVIFDHENFRIFNLKEQAWVTRKEEISDIDIERVAKEPYAHFFLKEIHEQVESSRNIISLYERGEVWREFVEAIDKAPRTFITGAGTSYHALLLGTYFFSNIAGVPLYPAIASQMLPLYSSSVGKDDLLVLVSQSGETKDLINVFNWSKSSGKGKTFAVVNNIGSTLALHCDGMIPIASFLEVAVPATKTYLNQVIAFLYCAYRLGQRRGLVPDDKLADELANLPSMVEETIKANEKVVKEASEALLPHFSLHILGYGLTHPVALEGALKMKEVVFNHPEGMYSSEFKHGPLAIVEKDYPVLFVALPRDENIVLSHMNEVLCRHGKVIHVGESTPGYEKVSHFRLPIPPPRDFGFSDDWAPYITSILSVIPLQMLAYEMAIAKGNNPDQPRNLSKTLTVD